MTQYPQREGIRILSVEILNSSVLFLLDDETTAVCTSRVCYLGTCTTHCGYTYRRLNTRSLRRTVVFDLGLRSQTIT